MSAQTSHKIVFDLYALALMAPLVVLFADGYLVYQTKRGGQVEPVNGNALFISFIQLYTSAPELAASLSALSEVKAFVLQFGQLPLIIGKQLLEKALRHIAAYLFLEQSFACVLNERHSAFRVAPVFSLRGH